MKTLVRSLLLLLSFAPLPSAAQAHGTWRSATEPELQAALPSRAPVEKERIETELRTASGIIDGQSHVIAGVVLITAGYSADGKYSHYLLLQAPLSIGDIHLAPGTYVFGWTRVPDGLLVRFYQAATGAELGSAIARQLPSSTRVEAFRVWPPADRSILQIGRFSLPYTIGP